MNTNARTGLVLVPALLSMLGGLVRAVPLGDAFTYQGQLQQSGSPVNDICDFQFSLWNAAGSGSPLLPAAGA